MRTTIVNDLLAITLVTVFYDKTAKNFLGNRFIKIYENKKYAEMSLWEKTTCASRLIAYGVLVIIPGCICARTLSDLLNSIDLKKVVLMSLSKNIQSFLYPKYIAVTIISGAALGLLFEPKISSFLSCSHCRK